MPRRATIVDVAYEAGVSFKTVSRVLNGGPHVRAATHERVMTAIRALNFQANPSARNLRITHNRQIAVFYSNASSSYRSEVQIGVLQRCNTDCFSATFEDVGQGLARLATRSSAHGLAGAIVVPPLTEDSALLRRLAELGIPFVRLAPGAAGEEAGHVSMDDFSAAAEMTEYLCSLGHRRIGFISGPDDHPQARLRRSGYEAALARHGLEVDSHLVSKGSFHFDSGIASAETLLSAPEPPTAIFASNDDMAAAVLVVAYRRGLRVSESLSVAGFDDTPLASVLVPSLTTICQPIRQMAAEAAGMLTAGPDIPGRRAMVLPHRLVLRNSTGPAPMTVP